MAIRSTLYKLWNGKIMPIKQRLSEMYSFMNWNYIGLAAGILSMAVTLYNINRYWEEIRKVEKP